MAILKFRVYLEEDDSVYRDIVIRHSQTFFDLHQCILKAYEFDNKHQATYYRSNDQWLRGREISVEKYDKPYKVPPLIMADTLIGSEIQQPNQKFVYVYDFAKNWGFLVELINVTKEESSKIMYPSVSRKEGIGHQQYGTKGLLGPKFAEIEEKYDLKEATEGFGEEGDIDDSETDDIISEDEAADDNGLSEL